MTHAGTRRTNRRRARAVATIAAAGAVAVLGLAGTSPAGAVPACVGDAPIITSNGALLFSHSPAGVPLAAVPTPGNPAIAYGADGHLYGVNLSIGEIRRIDPATGGTISSEPLSGAITGAPQPISTLTGLPNGNLLGGMIVPVGGATLFEIDPGTGVSVVWGDLPGGPSPLGNLVPLPGGDILHVRDVASGGRYAVYRVHPDATATQVGDLELPAAPSGLARSGGAIHVATVGGDIMRLGPIPATASTDVITTTPVASTGSALVDAASPGDLCAALSTSVDADIAGGTPLEIGRTVTHTLTLANTEGTLDAPVDHIADLTRLVDDARITAPPALVGGSGLTVGPVTTAGGRTTFAVTGAVPSGATATITYSATVTGEGDRRAESHLLAAGDPLPAACDPAAGACVLHPTAAPPSPAAQPTPAPTPLRGLGVPATRITQRLALTHAGRHTLILRDRVTGRRLRWLRGSRIGDRLLRRPATAPVLTTAGPGRRVAITARVAVPARTIRSGRVQLRVILNRTGNPLTDVVLRVAPGRR